MHYAQLKARHRLERDNHPPQLTLRIHRALSWLQRAEQAEDDDSRFIFLWIAFNAAYATEIDDSHRLSEQVAFQTFWQKLCELDGDKRFDNLVWQTFPGAIRVLLDNPYVFKSFWEYHTGKIDEMQWQQRLAVGKQRANTALAQGRTHEVLSIVFNRIYVLRNQLMHGGATFGSKTNRSQLRDCVQVLGQLVPLVITVMMDNPDTLWGEASFPVVD